MTLAYLSQRPLLIVVAVFAALALLVWATFGWPKALAFVAVMLAASLARNLCCWSAHPPEGKF